MIRKRMIRWSISLAVMLTLLLGSQISAMAASPTVEEVEHKGKGRVEVDFYGNVRYKNLKVSVKDTSGRKYKVTRVRRDDDEVKFTIKNYKAGKTYKITIKGVKSAGTQSFGKATAKLKIPKAAKGKAISARTAISKAKKDAKRKWGASGIWDVDVDKDRYRGQPVWEVSFSGTINGQEYEFEYEIARKGGKILRRGIGYYWKELDD